MADKNRNTNSSSLNQASPSGIKAVKVKGHEISKDQLNEQIKALFGGNMPDGKTDINQFDETARNELIKNIVVSDLILDEATAAGVEKSDEYKKAIAATSKDVERKIFIDNLVKKHVTEDKIKEEYNNLVKEFDNKEEVRAKHILVDSEDEAKEISKKIAAGESFEELAKQKSKDSSKEKGGDLGYFSKGMMVPAFEEAVFALKVGEVSKPVKSDFGWHIIKLEDRRKMTAPSFEESKPKLERMIAQKYIKEYVDGLLAQAQFEIVK
jgi:peptidyl-prolyl cis-trans isomerase C